MSGYSFHVRVIEYLAKEGFSTFEYVIASLFTLGYIFCIFSTFPIYMGNHDHQSSINMLSKMPHKNTKLTSLVDRAKRKQLRGKKKMSLHSICLWNLNTTQDNRLKWSSSKLLPPLPMFPFGRNKSCSLVTILITEWSFRNNR